MPPGHNMTLAALGAVILWFGWYGFNPGSTLSAMDFEGIGRVATNTTLAACAGALVAVAWVYPRSKKWDVGISINGLLAGLVAITARATGCRQPDRSPSAPSPGVIMILAVDFTEWIRVDDPCGAFAVHGACGILGTLSLGLFAVGNYGNPAFGRRRALLSTAATPTSWSPRSRAARRSSSCTAGRRPAADVRHQGARHAPDLRGGRARGSRHPRARCAGVPPGAVLRRATRRSRRTWRVSPPVSPPVRCHHRTSTCPRPTSGQRDTIASATRRVRSAEPGPSWVRLRRVCR